MNQMIKNAIKMSAAFFIIGAAITLASYPLAETLRPALEMLPGSEGLVDKVVAGSTVGHAAWTGSFFAMFGAMGAVVPPLVGKVFGLNEKDQSAEITIQKGKGISLKLAPEAGLESAFPEMEMEMDFGTQHAEGILAGRGADKKLHLEI